MKKLFSMLLFVFIFASVGLTMNAGNITLNYPTAAQVLDLNNNTLSFNVTVGSNASNYVCSVWVDDVQSTANNTFIVNNTLSSLNFSSPMANGSHSWFAQCGNLSDEVNSSAQNFWIDNAAPTVTMGMSQNTFNQGNTSLNATIYDIGGTSYFSNVSLFINGTYNQSRSNLANNTMWSVNFTNFAEGIYYFTIQAVDNVSRYTNGTTINFYIDRTAPSISMGRIPENATWNATAAQLFNLTISDNSLSSPAGFKPALNITVFFTGVSGGNASNISFAAFFNTSYANRTITFSEGNYSWYAMAVDNASNTYTTATYIHYMDPAVPVLGTPTIFVYNTTNQNIVQLTFSITDNHTATCGAWVVMTNGSSRYTLGTLNGTDVAAYCAFNLTYSSISFEGAFNFTIAGNDTLRNSANGTWTKNYTFIQLNTGWNLIQIQKNMTMLNFSRYMTGIVESISVYDRLNHTWITWASGSGTNQNYVLNDSMGVYVYVNTTGYLIRQWTHDSFANGSNPIAYYKGWNVGSFYNATGTTLKGVLAQNGTSGDNFNTSGVNMSYVSWYNSSATYPYITHRVSTATNSNITMARGYAFWFYINDSTQITMVRDANE